MRCGAERGKASETCSVMRSKLAAQADMPDLIAPALALAGLFIATAGYYLMVRRRGRDRHRRHADDWDRAIG